MTKKVLLALADGSEEIEAMAVVDVLRRAGADVTVASVDHLQVTLSRGVKVVADRLIQDCVDEEYDLIVLPGGMPGAEHLRDNETLISMLRAQKESGRLFAAICASPVIVLQHHGLIEGLNVTCYPSMIDQLANKDAAEFDVVVDKNCITSRGPDTALKFAIKLVEILFDQSRADQIAKAILVT